MEDQLNVLQIIWAELSKPSTGTGWYQWATIALGHVMVGALLITAVDYLLDLDGPGRESARAVLVFLYWALKELPDLNNGGIRADSFVDLSFVFIGTFYGAAWVPIAAFGAVLVGVAVIIRRNLL